VSVGRAFMQEWEQARLAEREAQTVTAKCAWCDWTHTDTLKAARDAHAAHRTAIHPERKIKPRKTRHKRTTTIVAGGRSIDDNIAEARRQGANGSDHPEPAPERVPEPAAAAEQPPRTIAAATTCVVDRCRMTPVARRGRYAGLCHEHRNEAARQPRKAA